MSLPGPLLIYPDAHSDKRGSFLELWNQKAFSQNGIRDKFVQINQSTSCAGVLRGMHYQLKSPQAKLCRLIHGVARDVIIDIRLSSPTFGQHTSWLMYAGDSHPMIYIPKGFAHGFLVLSERVVFEYFCSDYYSESDGQHGVRWDDPDLNLPWAINGNSEPVIVSAQDNSLPFLRDIPRNELPIYP